MKVWLDNKVDEAPFGYILCKRETDLIEMINFIKDYESVKNQNIGLIMTISEINILNDMDLERFSEYAYCTPYSICFHDMSKPLDGNMITFNIKCTMKKRWLNQFCSFLRRMERNGQQGHSEIISFMSDGDGDFRPTFDIDCKYDFEQPRNPDKNLYDAG